MDVLIFDLT